jgi:hypothetical protein
MPNNEHLPFAVLTDTGARQTSDTSNEVAPWVKENRSNTESETCELDSETHERCNECVSTRGERHNEL